MAGAPRRLATIGLLALSLIAACSPAPSPTAVATTRGPIGSPTSTPGQHASESVLPTDGLGAPPPAAVQTWLAKKLLIDFRPLTDSELARVQVTAATAQRLGLAEPAQGYGTAGDKIVWTKVGCVFLGYYKGLQMPSVGYVPPEFPAYLVQVIGPPAKGFPNLNIEAVLINAATGSPFGVFGFGAGPVLGTTCGVTP